jgi:phosphoglycolate phosphatase-like HAD superfamily hydrolase
VAGRDTAVCFDLDGTLLDSIDLIAGAFQHATHTQLGRPAERVMVIPTIGRPLTAVLEEMAPAACLYASDSCHDLAAAAAAGMPGAAALWGPNEPAALAALAPAHLLAALPDFLDLGPAR